MDKYEIFYKDVFIGLLSVNDEYKYCYEPNAEGVEEVKDHACFLQVMIEGSNGFGEPIPFFRERLRYMKLWNLDVIGYHTDWFTVKKIKE